MKLIFLDFGSSLLPVSCRRNEENVNGATRLIFSRWQDSNRMNGRRKNPNFGLTIAIHVLLRCRVEVREPRECQPPRAPQFCHMIESSACRSMTERVPSTETGQGRRPPNSFVPGIHMLIKSLRSTIYSFWSIYTYIY